ncbi:MAG TPA: 2OG-Fe(II) oxygenase family protein [Azospirillaceae bacterium]|nr:2OG-Fe(II) oxygenase family protein [Azospirillaceae bacterium]
MHASASPADHPPVRLSPGLDRAAIAARLRAAGRVHIDGILVPEAAARLHRCLKEEVAWNTIFNDGDEKIHALHATQVAAMTPQQQAALGEHILSGARKGFQFVFHNYPVWDLYQKKLGPDLYVNRVLEFLNGEEFLDFVREVSGIPEIGMADCQATLYKPHHFLTRHDDLGRPDQKRRLAYVLNMTPAWRPEWGGMLEFLDEAGNVTEGFIPSFNALNMFVVPTPHLVSYVTPFASGGRYSMTGWLREK